MSTYEISKKQQINSKLDIRISKVNQFKPFKYEIKIVNVRPSKNQKKKNRIEERENNKEKWDKTY